MSNLTQQVCIRYVPISSLHHADYNPRKHNEEQLAQLQESIKRFGLVDPLVVNDAPERENIIIGGNFRLETAASLGYTEVPVVFVTIPDIEKEKELNIRLNKNQGEFDLELLAEFDESFLADIGFDSEEIDEIFSEEDTPETFNLKEALAKAGVDEVVMKKGEIYDLDGSRLMIGDSTIEADMLKLMGNDKADMVMTDPPYRLDYLKGKKKNGKSVEGFGAKRDRKYLETDVLPDDFTELWMANAFKVSQKDSSIICYENWKNIREIWNTMEKHWKVRNMIVWHLPNRVQGFSAKHRFFNKHDIAVVGTSEDHTGVSLEPEEDPLLQEEYETALYATTGKPQWESYGKDKKYCPTDFIEYVASDEKSSGQGVIFGTKPIEILIPYIKVLTKRDQIVLEPFGGSGSTLIASTKLKRRCFIMEKVPAYAEVIRKRWENATGKKAVRIND